MAVANSCGNDTSSAAEVLVNPVPSQTLSVVDASSCVSNDGSITSSVSGGMPGYFYSWSNGKSTSAVTGLAQGNYSVTVTDSQGCTTVNTATVTCPTAVDQLSEQDGVVISPNPNNGIFIIDSQEKEYELTIFNVFGEKIFSQRMVNKKSEINLCKEPSGIYFLQSKTGQGVVTKKIVIDR